MAKDLFSKQAEGYARYRPVYPPELYEYIYSFVKEKNTAWDCATGNGQAALELARVFEKVYATDISEQQLKQAQQHKKIHYSTTAAEETPFADNSFNLVTVAQAYHWFNFDAFYKEVMRVACKEAVIAIWGYSLVQCSNEKINAHIQGYYKNVVGPFWDRERRFVDEHYTTVLFPWQELPSKQFEIAVQWTIADFNGYLNTWSALQHFIKANQYNPVDGFITELQKYWPAGELLSFHFPVFLRLGRVK